MFLLDTNVISELRRPVPMRILALSPPRERPKARSLLPPF